MKKLFSLIGFLGVCFLAILSYWNIRKIDSPSEMDILVYERISGNELSPTQNIPDVSEQVKVMWQANLLRKIFFIIQMCDDK